MAKKISKKVNEEKMASKVEAVNTEVKTLKEELDINKSDQNKLKEAAATLLKEEEEKIAKFNDLQELKPSGKPIKKSPLKPTSTDMLTMIDSQGRNWEIDEKGTLLRRI